MIIVVLLALASAAIVIDETVQPIFSSVGKSTFPYVVAKCFSQIGATPGIAVFIMTGIALAFLQRRILFEFGSALLLSGVAVQVVKFLVGRVRPNLIHDRSVFYGPFGMFNHGRSLAMDSMPSGHTTVAFAMACILSRHFPARARLWFCLSLCVAMARVVLDRHFLSDVLYGAALGLAIGWNVIFALKRTND